MKRLLNCLLAFLLLISISADAVDIHIAPTGSDNNPGTKQKPLATLHTALRKARELRRLNDPSIANGIHIIVNGGIYPVYDPVFIRPEDGGSTTSPTIIEAAKGGQPIFTGGIRIEGWKELISSVPGLQANARGHVWVADLPLVAGRLFEFRQLWVNDKKAVRAKDCNGEYMNRILSWNKSEQSCWIPFTENLPLDKIQGLEMFIHQWWAIATLRIKKVEQKGDSARLFFYQPESKIQSEHPWPAPWISKETGNSAFYLANAIQFLDEPGEWYLDIANRKLYYWPRLDEDLKTATVMAPFTETLLRIQGTPDHPVTNIYVKGISFQHTGWLRPSHFGHVPHQAGMYMTDAYKLRPAGTSGKLTLDNQAWIGRPAAAVEISFADNTGFENCSFRHLASTGLDYHKGVHDNHIKGNLFRDIGGTAILAGVYADEATEIHLPYNPGDEREVCDRLQVSNNLITDVANEDWSCVGIGAGYTRNTIISYNEIENLSYSGISMGWGWSPVANVMKNNKIVFNKIHHFGKHNYDCAGIYTLSAQPGSVISNNYIDSIYKAPYAHLPSHWFYLYTDEGSSGITIKDNWTPSPKFLQNANGPGNEWINNGPQVNEKIKREAGLQPVYQYLANEKTSPGLTIPVNEEHKEVIELVLKENATLDIKKLKNILQQNRIDTSAIYGWKGHYFIFDNMQDVSVMQGKLKNNFPGVEVRVYYDMFYEYDKQKHCPDKTIAKDWDHILLTANLVADKKLQQEYLRYHAEQFTEWPEVTKGFCNAGFQQLLLYRNGRQLVLVISIPRGQSLDKLNLKTTEGNPRVNEWNKLMSKYQEGIEGTRKDEVWIFLKNIIQ